VGKAGSPSASESRCGDLQGPHAVGALFFFWVPACLSASPSRVFRSGCSRSRACGRSRRIAPDPPRPLRSRAFYTFFLPLLTAVEYVLGEINASGNRRLRGSRETSPLSFSLLSPLFISILFDRLSLFVMKVRCLSRPDLTHYSTLPPSVS